MADDLSFQSLMGALMQQPQQQSPWSGLQNAAPVPQAYPLMPQQTNLPQANAAMNLSPQEQALYMRHITNLYGPGGVDNPPDAQNPQGSRSTLYQAVQEHNGRFYSVPTVWDGRREVEPYTRRDGTVMDVPNATALANVARAGWNTFPSSSNPDDADARYEQMHSYLEKDTSDYFRNRGK